MTEVDGGALAGIDVAVLAGGLATRLAGVLGDTPKVLAPINGRPYLDHLVARLANFGAIHIVLCLGHLAEKVVAHVAQVADSAYSPVTVETVVESRPLGTAGALRLACPLLRSDPVMVINGDTWTDADFGAFADAHRRAGAQVSVLCVEVDDVGRYGRVEIDANGRISRYAEKGAAATGRGTISGGFYLFSRATIEDLSKHEGSSLERDYLQHMPAGTLNAFIAEGAAFIDIGTPESLAAAGRLFPPAAPVLGKGPSGT